MNPQLTAKYWFDQALKTKNVWFASLYVSHGHNLQNAWDELFFSRSN